MSAQLWRLNGKLITSDGVIVRCEQCPCDDDSSSSSSSTLGSSSSNIEEPICEPGCFRLVKEVYIEYSDDTGFFPDTYEGLSGSFSGTLSCGAFTAPISLSASISGLPEVCCAADVPRNVSLTYSFSYPVNHKGGAYIEDGANNDDSSYPYGSGPKSESGTLTVVKDSCNTSGYAEVNAIYPTCSATIQITWSYEPCPT